MAISALSIVPLQAVPYRDETVYDYLIRRKSGAVPNSLFRALADHIEMLTHENEDLTNHLLARASDWSGSATDTGNPELSQLPPHTDPEDVLRRLAALEEEEHETQ